MVIGEIVTGRCDAPPVAPSSPEMLAGFGDLVFNGVSDHNSTPWVWHDSSESQPTLGIQVPSCYCDGFSKPQSSPRNLDS